MRRLWLTDRAYSLWPSLIRIAYWLAAIFLSSLYLQNCSGHVWFKIGLMMLSLMFVIGFIGFTRILDHFFKSPKL